MFERGPAAVGVEIHRREGFDPAQSTGLFVGVSRFEDERWAEVPYAVDDAVDLAYLFSVELGLLWPAKVRLALAGEPQKPDSKKRLEELGELGAKAVAATQTKIYRQVSKQSRAAGKDGLFLLSMATHGVSAGGENYLVAEDTLAELIEKTAVEVDVIFEHVAEAGAPRRLLLLDACRERLRQGERGVQGAPMEASFADAIAAASGLAVLAGATLGGYAYDDDTVQNGAFTRFVLDGLRGAAPADERGLITVRTLGDFLQTQLVAWVRAHRPDHAKVSLGIARQIEGPAESLPLAVNPELYRARELFLERRERAIARLKENFGPVLTGSLFDEIVARLPEQVSPPGSEAARAVEALLDEIEALDGTPRLQRSLKAYLGDLQRAAEPAEGAASPPSPAPFPHPAPARETLPAGEKPVASPPAVTKLRESCKSLFTPGGRERLDSGLDGVLIAGLHTERVARSTTAEKSKWKKPLVVLGIIAAVLMIIWLTLRLFSRETPPPWPEPPLPASSEPGDLYVNLLGWRFRFIPAGEYKSDSSEDEVLEFSEGETLHDVKLTRGFWLAESEVTQGQWNDLVKTNPSRFADCGSDCPVEQVNWFEAVAFANLLSARAKRASCYELEGCSGELGKEGYSCSEVRYRGPECTGYRLPTEAEWEIAARAGTTTAIWTDAPTETGDKIGVDLEPIAWYSGNSGRETHPVCKKDRNPWELCDMLGNVNEWVWDLDGTYSKGTARVVRGGSWNSYARSGRGAYRNWFHPFERDGRLGFRLALGPAPAEPDGAGGESG